MIAVVFNFGVNSSTANIAKLKPPRIFALLQYLIRNPGLLNVFEGSGVLLLVISSVTDILRAQSRFGKFVGGEADNPLFSR